MIAHLVLYQPRPDLSSDARRDFVRALEDSLARIPSIREFTLGRRLRTGATYDTGTPAFDYLVLFQFDDEAGLREYLAHPAHQALGRLFYTCSALAIAMDFVTASGDDARAQVARLDEHP